MNAKRIAAILLKYYYITINRIDRIFDLIFWPIVNLLVWGFLTFYFVGISTQPNIINLLLGGLLLWTFVWRAQNDISIYILEDFWSRNLYNTFASPLTIGEIVAATFILAIVRSLLSFALLIVLALILYSYNIFAIGIFYIVLFSSILLLFGYVLGLFVAAMIFRYGMRIQIFAWSVGFLVQPFSAVFYPLSSLPGWAQTIAIVLPSTHVFEGMRAVINTGNLSVSSLVIATLLNFFYLGLMLIFFAQSLKRARRIGLLTRNE